MPTTMRFSARGRAVLADRFRNGRRRALALDCRILTMWECSRWAGLPTDVERSWCLPVVAHISLPGDSESGRGRAARPLRVH